MINTIAGIMPNFISLEGPSGVGKTTIREKLMKRIRNEGLYDDILTVYSPGYDAVAEEIRKIVKNPSGDIHGLTSLLMFLAAQNNTMEYHVKPFINANTGNLVISDRWTLSSFIYQSHFQKLPLETIKRLQAAAQSMEPCLTFVLNMSPEALHERRHGRNDEEDVDMYEQDSFLPIEVQKYKDSSKDMRELFAEEEHSPFRVNNTSTIHHIDNSGSPDIAVNEMMRVLRAYVEGALYPSGN